MLVVVVDVTVVEVEVVDVVVVVWGSGDEQDLLASLPAFVETDTSAT